MTERCDQRTPYDCRVATPFACLLFGCRQYAEARRFTPDRSFPPDARDVLLRLLNMAGARD